MASRSESVDDGVRKSVRQIVEDLNTFWATRLQDDTAGVPVNIVKPARSETKEKKAPLLSCESKTGNEIKTMKQRDDMEDLRSEISVLTELLKQVRSPEEKKVLQSCELSDVMKKLEGLRCQSVKHCSSLGKVKDTVFTVSRYCEVQHKENKKMMSLVAGLRDELAALRQISAETQQRQLDELQPHQQQQQQDSGKHVVMSPYCK